MNEPIDIQSEVTETPAQKAARELADAKRREWRAQVWTEGIRRLEQLERVSQLPIEDFFRALLLCAANEALLRASLQRGEVSERLPGEADKT